MKIAIITDQHFGCRKNSKHFHDYFLKFYNDTFFPTLEKEGITTIVDMEIPLIVERELISHHWHGQRIIIMIVLSRWDVKFIP